MSDELREIPVEIHRRDGGTVPGRIVAPQWTQSDLEAFYNRQAKWGNITREQADREIKQMREEFARQQPQRQPDAPTRSRGRSR